MWPNSGALNFSCIAFLPYVWCELGRRAKFVSCPFGLIFCRHLSLSHSSPLCFGLCTDPVIKHLRSCWDRCSSSTIYSLRWGLHFFARSCDKVGEYFTLSIWYCFSLSFSWFLVSHGSNYLSASFQFYRMTAEAVHRVGFAISAHIWHLWRFMTVYVRYCIPYYQYLLTLPYFTIVL